MKHHYLYYYKLENSLIVVLRYVIQDRVLRQSKEDQHVLKLHGVRYVIPLKLEIPSLLRKTAQDSLHLKIGLLRHMPV